MAIDLQAENAGEQKFWSAIRNYWDAIDIYASPEDFLVAFEALPEPIGHLIAVCWCDQEICNGGFYQFFKNGTGILAPEAIIGYQAIGLLGCAKIVEKPIAMFGNPYPRDRKLRHSILGKLDRDGETREQWDPFGSFDTSYYAIKNKERIFETMGRYAENHAGQQ